MENRKTNKFMPYNSSARVFKNLKIVIAIFERKIGFNKITNTLMKDFIEKFEK